MEKMSSRCVIIGVIATMIVAIIGVTYAYWRAQIEGEGSQISITLDKVYILFTDTQEIVESKVRPGWSTRKTFTIENQGSTTFKYDIYIKDLINTLEVDGFFQYKITSDNNGYNMSDYKSIDKSLEASDYDLAIGINIESGVKQTYTIEFRYVDSPDVDQSEDMGKTISGSLMIRENTYELAGRTLYSVLTDGDMYPTIKKTRTSGDFDTSLGGETIDSSYNTTGVIYKESTYKESGKDVYYFAGNPQDNWVKFAGFYWRIIRTNEDGSVRLLYAGTTPDTTEGYIGTSAYNSANDNTRYVGWMYGEEGSIENNRTNTTDSEVKTFLDNWYANEIARNSTYSSLISTDAIYCNDRASGEYAATGWMYYAAAARLSKVRVGLIGNQPTYQCGQNASGGYFASGSDASSSTWISSTAAYTSSLASSADKFSVTTDAGGNGQLRYPVGLMTADEVSFAGGLYANKTPNTYYYRNSITSGCTGASGDPCSVTGATLWWTMSPYRFVSTSISNAGVFRVYGSGSNPGFLDSTPVLGSHAVRPVLSLKPEVIVTSGNGTSENPYEVSL